MKLIAVTLLSVKNHEKTASFPLIRENPREQLRLPPPDFPIHPENFFVYYVGSMKTKKILHVNRNFSHFFRKKIKRPYQPKWPAGPVCIFPSRMHRSVECRCSANDIGQHVVEILTGAGRRIEVTMAENRRA